LELTGLRDIGTEGKAPRSRRVFSRPTAHVLTREAYVTVGGGRVGYRAAF
jgi:hypothetical protein